MRCDGANRKNTMPYQYRCSVWPSPGQLSVFKTPYRVGLVGAAFWAQLRPFRGEAVSKAVPIPHRIAAQPLHIGHAIGPFCRSGLGLGKGGCGENAEKRTDNDAPNNLGHVSLHLRRAIARQDSGLAARGTCDTVALE